MITTYLRSIFQNYLLTIGYCHAKEVEAKLEAVGRSTAIDVLAYLPRLESWILCWSSTGSNSVNRVFIPSTHGELQTLVNMPRPRILYVPYRQAKQHAIDTDVTLLAQRKGVDSVVYVPLLAAQFGTFGVIRLIGAGDQIAKIGYKRDAVQVPMSIELPGDFPDIDLIPHVLGRWAGTLFRHRGTSKPIETLLRVFSSFFPISHDMYWKRDFERDEIGFDISTTPNTERILGGLKSPIGSHDYMFSIVAERGVSEIVEHFPEGLQNGARINRSGWKLTQQFNQLVLTLESEHVSYIGVPIKVDDAVIGVVSLLTPRGKGSFASAARFIRSAISEMGRTIDKSAVMRTSRIIRRFASEKASDEKKKIHLPSLGKDLVSKLVEELLPFGRVRVGYVEARLGGEEQSEGDLPQELKVVIENQLVQLIVAEDIALFLFEPKQLRESYLGMIVVPIPAALPFVLYVWGPLSLISGRSLRSALEELQAVLMVFLAASERFLSAGADISNWRQHLLLWSHVHDIKNSTASFGTPLATLVSVAQHGTHADLKREVLRFKERISGTVSDFKAKCDQTLRGAGFRRRESVSIIEVLRRAWTVTRSYREVMRQCRVSLEGERELSAVTYPKELEIVLSNLFLNVVHHFERTRTGNIVIRCSLAVKKKDIIIEISDSVPEKGAVSKVNSILDDPNSDRTLKRFVKPIVERVLQGQIWAEPNPEVDSVVMKLRFPTEAAIH